MKFAHLIAALAGLASAIVVGCSGIGASPDILNCYSQGGIEPPEGANLYNCYANISPEACGCDGQSVYETVAAPDGGSALSCWFTELTQTVGSMASLSSYGCPFAGVYHRAGGGAPNGWIDDEADEY